MRAFLKEFGKKGRAGAHKIGAFFYAYQTHRIARIVLLALASAATLVAGWRFSQIASGFQEGVAPSFLPDTLPLLFSGALYIDRFAAVFGVLLAAAVLLTFLEASRGAVVRGLTMGVLVLGVLSASTPLTLVAWLVVIMVVVGRDVPQKARLGFLLSMSAIILALLALSGGAFLAEMTIVATVSSQLSPGFVFFALLLLFAGALFSVRSLRGAYLLVPIYVSLRLCLFFLSTAPVLLLTFVAFVAVISANHAARMQDVHAYARAAVYLLFLSVPLTMIGVHMQVITAVQCFLFGGLAIAASGVLLDTPVRWPMALRKIGVIITRLVASVFPGTLLGCGSLLIFAGFWAIAGVTTGVLELLYIAFLAVLVLCAVLFMMRHLVARNVYAVPGFNFSGPVQALLLAVGGIGFAQILAFLGTTIGGEIPDSVVTIAFTSQTLSFIPWICFVVSGVVVVFMFALRTKRPDAWQRIAKPICRAYAWVDARMTHSRALECVRALYRKGLIAGNALLVRLESLTVYATPKESAILIFACLVVTLIVLF